MTNRQIKRKSQTFSLTDDEMGDFMTRAKHHGFADRNEYLLALVEADISMSLVVTLHPTTKQKVLRAMSDLDRAQADLAVRARFQRKH